MALHAFRLVVWFRFQCVVSVSMCGFGFNVWFRFQCAVSVSICGFGFNVWFRFQVSITFPARCPQVPAQAYAYFVKFDEFDVEAKTTRTLNDTKVDLPVWEEGDIVRPRPRPHLLSEPRAFEDVRKYLAANLRESSSWRGLDPEDGRYDAMKAFTGRQDMWRALLGRNTEDAGQFEDGVPLQMEASVDFGDWHCMNDPPDDPIVYNKRSHSIVPCRYTFDALRGSPRSAP